MVHPMNALIVVQLAAVVLALLRWRRTAITLLALTTLAFALVAWSALGDAMLHGLEHAEARPQLPAKVDGIVVLGGAEHAEMTAAYGMAHMNDDSERLTTFVGLARQYPEAKLVFTGG